MSLLFCTKWAPGSVQTGTDKKSGIPETLKPLKILVFASGFEPLAYRLGGGRSILLSYANVLQQVLVYHKKYRSYHNNQRNC